MKNARPLPCDTVLNSTEENSLQQLDVMLIMGFGCAS